MNPETSTPASQSIAAPIAEVTVYTNQALVTRRGMVSLTGSERELVISGLPLTLQTDSVRAKVGNSVSEKLLGVRTEKVFASETFAKRIVQIGQQIRQLEEQQRYLRDLLRSVGLQRDFVRGLGEKSVERYSGLNSPDKISLNEIKEFLDFLGQQHGEYAKTIAQREKEQQEIDRQLEALRQQRQQMVQPAYKETLSSYKIVVTVELANPVEFELEVSYLVNRAIWTPVYDLRTSSGSKRVNLNYLAEVRQKTGEDWMGVALKLSTAKPALTTMPPKLKPWYIDSLDAAPVPALELREDTDFAELEALLADETDALKKQNVLETQKVVSSLGSIVTFCVDGGCNIPADAAAHKVVIFSQDYPCSQCR